jgi:4-alpha-glucanotransferase
VQLPRAAGVLLHPTSLPGPFGIGDLGPAAYRFVDWLVSARQTVWQVLPLVPIGGGDSPYAGRSAFAGNTLLVSPERLVEDGLLPSDFSAPSTPDGRRINYRRVGAQKASILRQAFGRLGQAPAEVRSAFEEFKAGQAAWLEDYALFDALKSSHRGAWWLDWEPELAQRQPRAIARARSRLRQRIEFCRFEQFLFFRQWQQVRAYANAAGVLVMGDAPIFVAHDSADVWANPELFRLDSAGRPIVVAGVPPDYFSETGQLWGNPIYAWDREAETGYAWWIDRLRADFARYDVLRLDHFRGFQAYWAVPAGETTAINGKWAPGPGAALFDAATARLGPLPIIAEDLGLITPAVKRLRKSLGFPGMKVLQFAFDSDAFNDHLPHNHERECLVYTGTHDNDTTRGWFLSANAKSRHYMQRVLGRGVTPASSSRDLIALAYSSVADWAMAPLQDVLGLGASGRMNLPGKLGGNWGWRYRANALTPELADGLAALATDYARVPALVPVEPPEGTTEASADEAVIS